MWPFRRKHFSVTTEQLAPIVMEFMRRRGRQSAADLQNQAQEKWRLEQDEITVLGHEIFLAFLWATSKVLDPDKALLDSLHDGYFQSCFASGTTHEDAAARANAAQTELAERYRQYYQAWEKDATSSNGRFALASAMAKCFFPKRRPDIEISAFIGIDIQLFMKGLLQLRSEYEFTKV